MSVASSQMSLLIMNDHTFARPAPVASTSRGINSLKI